MTTLAEYASAATGNLSAAASGADRLIRWSTAAVVLAVAGIAADISYWHAYAVVRAYGETGLTARLEPATIDGLVYASSMVILYAARHRLPVPGLARCLLAVGIIATLAVNMAQGWSHGPGGMLVASWPAVSLVGSYELLVWMVRKAASAGAAHVSAGTRYASEPIGAGEPAWFKGQALAGSGGAGRQTPAGAPDHANQHTDQATQNLVRTPADGPATDGDEMNRAAVEAYLASVREGKPLSERKLAARFGTSRRWARNRMADARKTPVPG